MYLCKVTHFFFKILPFKVWQDLLFCRHIQDCPSCQQEMATAEEAKTLLIQEDEMSLTGTIWPAVRMGLDQVLKKRRHLLQPSLGWATATAGLLVIIALGLWVIFGGFPTKAPIEQNIVERFQIKYLRIEDKPAKAYLYTVNEPKMVFVWAERNS
jgi:hypothetical protein